MWAGKMTWQLRAHTPLLEDQRLDSNIHVRWLTTSTTPDPGDLTRSDLCWNMPQTYKHILKRNL